MLHLIISGVVEFLMLWYMIHYACDAYLYRCYSDAYDRQRKGSSIIEWMFFTRFTKKLPKSMKFANYFVLFAYPIVAIALVILWFFRDNVPFYSIAEYTLLCLFLGIAIVGGIIILLKMEKKLDKKHKNSNSDGDS